MWNKTFLEAEQIDVGPYIQKRDGQDYLPWGICKQLLHEHGAERVEFYPVPGADGSSLHMTQAEFKDKNGVTNRCYEVHVRITVDANEWTVVYPVMNGNNPVKDNSMNQLRVSNAVRRAFVKGVAERLGLGFKLWLGEDDLPTLEEELGKHNLRERRQQVTDLISNKIAMGIPLPIIAERLGRSEEELRGILGWYGVLDKLEKKIMEMQP